MSRSAKIEPVVERPSKFQLNCCRIVNELRCAASRSAIMPSLNKRRLSAILTTLVPSGLGSPARLLLRD